jgi:hypothetical protein
MATCNYIQPINETSCLTDSLATFNYNFSSLDVGVANALALYNKLETTFGTFTPGLTSLDKSILYFARFTEAYNPLTTSSLTIPAYVIDRKLNTVDYNCNNDGEEIATANGYYKLDTATGIVTVPPGVYDIDAEASMMGSEAHVANLVYVDKSTNTPADVLFHGSAEYTEQAWEFWPPTWGKMRGRAIFNTETRLKIKHYIANGATPVRRGRTFKDDGITTDTTGFFGANPLTYYSFFNIQKIKDL